MGPFAIASVVFSVISIGVQIVQAQSAKKKAKREAALQQAQLDIKARQDELERQRQVAASNRLIRANRARILNQAAGQNVQFSSPVTGAITGLATRGRANINFINQSRILALEADRVTQRQIELQRQTAISNSNQTIAGAIVGGLGDIANQFPSTDSPSEGNDFTNADDAGL